MKFEYFHFIYYIRNRWILSTTYWKLVYLKPTSLYNSISKGYDRKSRFLKNRKISISKSKEFRLSFIFLLSYSIRLKIIQSNRIISIESNNLHIRFESNNSKIGFHISSFYQTLVDSLDSCLIISFKTWGFNPLHFFNHS